MSIIGPYILFPLPSSRRLVQAANATFNAVRDLVLAPEREKLEATRLRKTKSGKSKVSTSRASAPTGLTKLATQVV